MKTLKVKSFGDDVQGVELRGDRRNPEPIHFRVAFPGGDVEVVRATDGDNAEYWVHIRVNGEDAGETGAEQGRFVRARLDIRSKSTAEADIGDFENPGLYHLAVRVGRVEQ